jgi:hypothetical protein
VIVLGRRRSARSPCGRASWWRAACFSAASLHRLLRRQSARPPWSPRGAGRRGDMALHVASPVAVRRVRTGTGCRRNRHLRVGQLAPPAPPEAQRLRLAPATANFSAFWGAGCPANGFAARALEWRRIAARAGGGRPSGMSDIQWRSHSRHRLGRAGGQDDGTGADWAWTTPGTATCSLPSGVVTWRCSAFPPTADRGRSRANRRSLSPPRSGCASKKNRPGG